MIIAFLVVIGLCLGSFVNALVYRLHMQSQKGKKSGKQAASLSIVHGRSLCPHCKHELAAKDLIPVLSWLSLGGKCRYCRKKIEDSPLVELATAGLFVVSYVFWPGGNTAFGVSDWLNFGAWLVFMTGFMALVIYDLKWMLLPNRVVYPLMLLAGLLAVYNVISGDGLTDLYRLFGSLAIAGGLFLLLFQISDGKWIGGGDVKLGLLSGLLLADPYKAFLMLLLASTLGTFVVAPGLATKHLKATSRIPFGPFLIVSTIIVYLFGASIIDWYRRSFGI